MLFANVFGYSVKRQISQKSPSPRRLRFLQNERPESLWPCTRFRPWIRRTVKYLPETARPAAVSASSSTATLSCMSGTDAAISVRVWFAVLNSAKMTGENDASTCSPAAVSSKLPKLAELRDRPLRPMDKSRMSAWGSDTGTVFEQQSIHSTEQRSVSADSEGQRQNDYQGEESGCSGSCGRRTERLGAEFAS